MLYFKRLIQIPKLPDVREQGVGTDYKLVLAAHWGRSTEGQFILNLYFFLWLHLTLRPESCRTDQTHFFLSLIRPHLTFYTQLHLQNMWSRWWSSLRRTNRSNKMMMTTTTRSHSSRLARPQHLASKHSHKYGTWLFIAHKPVQYNRD